MKATKNIETLKAMINADVLECVETRIYGVQAYAISSDEYEVIIEAKKINGRYYFIDRNGRRYLMSRYERAEFVAGEILENVANAENAARLCAEQVKNHGRAGVHHDITTMFYDACEALGVEVDYLGCHLNNGEVFNDYARKTTEPTTTEEPETVEAETTEEETTDTTTTENEQKGESVAQKLATVKAYALAFGGWALGWALTLVLVAMACAAPLIAWAAVQAFAEAPQGLGVADWFCLVAILSVLASSIPAARWMWRENCQYNTIEWHKFAYNLL